VRLNVPGGSVRGPLAITFRGRTILRRHTFAHPAQIACPDGHRLKLGAMTILDNTGLSCVHRPASGQGECGALMWLLYLPAPDGRSLFYVADVTRQELDLWVDERYTLEGMLRYVGAWL
jgi:hypothetical protein